MCHLYKSIVLLCISRTRADRNPSHPSLPAFAALFLLLTACGGAGDEAASHDAAASRPADGGGRRDLDDRPAAALRTLGALVTLVALTALSAVVDLVSQAARRSLR